MKRILSILIALILTVNEARAQNATGVDIANSCGLAQSCGALIADIVNSTGSLIPGADNTYDVGSASLGYRTGYFDTSVITPLLISPGTADLIHRIDDDAQRLHTIGASSDTALTYKYGDGGTTAVQQLTLSASTADADDDSSTILCGGGAAGGTRGACITLPGEEVSGGSDITYDAGTSDTHIFSFAGTADATFSVGQLTVVTDGWKIASNTSDATDNKSIAFCGGGTCSGARGGAITIYGNEESAGLGAVNLRGGALATGHVELQTAHASSNVLIKPNGTTLWTANATGELLGAGTATIGWAIVAGANTACTTTCTTPCVFGVNTAATEADIVACSDATADECLCAGAS